LYTTKIHLRLVRTLNGLEASIRQSSTTEDADEFATVAASVADDWNRRLTEISLARYELTLRAWSTWLNSESTGDEPLSPASMDKYCHALGGMGKSPHSIVAYLISIRALLRRMRFVDTQTIDVIQRTIRYARTHTNRFRRNAPPLQVDSLAQMLSVVDRAKAREVRDAAIFLIMYDTLALPHELVGRQGGKRSQEVLPREAYSRRPHGTGRLTILPSLHDARPRSLTLSRSTADWVDAWLSFGQAERYLFFMEPQELGRRLTQWLRRAGIPSHAISPMSVRAGAIQDMLSRGVSTEAIRQLARRKCDAFIYRVVQDQAPPSVTNYDTSRSRRGADVRKLRPFRRHSTCQLSLGI